MDTAESSAPERLSTDEVGAVPGCGLGDLLRTVVKVVALGAGAIAASNAYIQYRTPPPAHRLGGVFARYPSRHGDLAYTVAGQGPPLLLLHGLGIGNSMAEWAENFSALAAHHTVYALDLLGWGLSDKSREYYTAAGYVEQVHFFLEDIVQEPCTLVASAQSALLALQVAERAPAQVRGLVLVCPATSVSPAGAGEVFRLSQEVAGRVLRWPLLGPALYNLMASRKYIDQFCREHLFYNKNLVTVARLRQYYVSGHQPGAHLAFASLTPGLLDVAWEEVWGRLSQPALLIWGRHAQLQPVDLAPAWLAVRDAELAIIDDAMMLPHVEQSAEFNRLVLEWLSRLPATSPVESQDEA